MKVTIVGRQMNVWEEMKATIEAKLGKLDKYFSDECTATATLSSRRNQKCLEITIVCSGTIFRSEVEGETFNNSLDEAIENIVRQIRKYKTKIERDLRADAFTEIEDDFDLDEPEYEMRVKTFPVKPMSAEEAILQMNLLGHMFFVFRDADTSDICVVYKRKDGAYGLIVPQ